MKTIELSGFIKIESCDPWTRIKLVQEDGYKIDLINRVQEAIENYPKHSIQVSYYLSNKACTINEMIEGWLRKLSGSVKIGYDKNEYSYSSWTSGVDYDTEFIVGKHNIYRELICEQGKFIIIQLNFKETKIKSSKNKK